MEDRYLFKAKTVTDGTWVQGYYVYDYARDIHYIFANEIACPNCINDRRRDFSLQDYEVDPSTICQCTGLKYKNDNLIWENDIIKTQVGTAKVVWDKSEWRIEWLKNNLCRKDLYYWAVEDIQRIEVIGNIFDNKDLLESEE